MKLRMAGPGDGEALLSIYENQRSDEIPTLDGSVTLMNAKFFDPRRYDLTKAGRFKLRKKLNAFARTYHTTLAQDIVGADGTIFMESGTNIRRDERNGLAQLTAAPSAPASELDAQIDEAEEDDGGAEVCQRLYGEADECFHLIFTTCPFYQRGATLYQSIPV